MDCRFQVPGIFQNWMYQKEGIRDTFVTVSGFLRGQKEYFWRISASNAAGKSGYSEIRSFTTGFPEAPMLVYPTNNTSEIPLVFDFTWRSETSAETYDLQVSRGADFIPQSILIDTAGIADTSFSSPEMEPDKIYFWRVGANNEFGFSGWSEVYTYKTTNLTVVEADTEIPDKFNLSQNYPNPFNPETVIEFSVPESNYITLTVYDLLGREVVKLVNEDLSAGIYNVKFSGENLTSGIYIYVLNNGSEALSHKMMLVK